MKKYILKISVLTALIIFTCLSFISCAEEVDDRGLVSISVDSSSSKGLGTKFDGYNSEDYWWDYMITKTDNEFVSGAKDNFVHWRSDKGAGVVDVDDAKGLNNTYHELSKGGWELTLRAYTNSTRLPSELIYEGSTKFLNNEPTGSKKLVLVPLDYQDFEADGLGHSTTRLKGAVKVDIPNITNRSSDNTTYELDPGCTKKVSVYVFKYNGTLGDTISKTDLVSPFSAEVKSAVDTGVYVLNIVYDYYKGSDKVASYIATDTFNVHGNLTTTISGELEFISLASFDIIYENGDIVFKNGRTKINATSAAATGGDYSGDNASVLKSQYNKYQYGTGLVLSDATTPLDAKCLKTGYTFGGWFTNTGTTTSQTDVSDGTDQVIGKFDAGKKIIYAKWTPNKYTFTIDGNKGTGSTNVPATVTVTAYYDDYLPVIVATNYTNKRKGYLFNGMYFTTATVLEEKVYTSGTETVGTGRGASLAIVKSLNDLEDTTFTDANGYFQQTKDRTIYAGWTAEKAKIILNKNETSYSSMTNEPTFAESKTQYDATFDELAPELNQAVLAGWRFEGYGKTADKSTATDEMIFNRIGVISNTNYGDEDGNWVYDGNPAKEEPTTDLNFYAKWTPLKTHITLLGGGAEKGSDGEAWVEYDNTTLTSITPVAPALPTTHVHGYYTKPDGEGGIMVLTSQCNFAVNLDGTTLNDFIRNDGGKYKWYRFDKDNEYDPLEMTLYAHYVVDSDVVVKYSYVEIDYNMEGMYGTFTGTDLQNVTVLYGANKIALHKPVSDLGFYLIGIYADEACNNRIAYDDGRIVEETDVPNFTKGGKWICTLPTVRLYTKWSRIMPEENVCTVMFYGNGGDGFMETQKIPVPCTSNVAITMNSFTAPSGKSFIGWNSKPDGTGLWYYDGYSSNKWKKETIMLYAQWDTTGRLSTSMYEPVNYVKMKSSDKTYINIGAPSEAFMDVTFYNTLCGGGFVLGADNYTETSKDDCISVYLAMYSSNMRCHVDAHSSWDIGDTMTMTGLNHPNGYDYARFVASNGNSCVTDDPDTAPVKVGSYSGDFRCGTDWLLFGSLRCNVYNSNAMGNNNSYCGGVMWVKSDGSEWFHLIPCRLKTSITAAKSKDGVAHSAGEIGMWDLVTDKFYAKTSGANFTCELN